MSNPLLRAARKYGSDIASGIAGDLRTVTGLGQRAAPLVDHEIRTYLRELGDAQARAEGARRTAVFMGRTELPPPGPLGDLGEISRARADMGVPEVPFSPQVADDSDDVSTLVGSLGVPRRYAQEAAWRRALGNIEESADELTPEQVSRNAATMKLVSGRLERLPPESRSSSLAYVADQAEKNIAKIAADRIAAQKLAGARNERLSDAAIAMAGGFGVGAALGQITADSRGDTTEPDVVIADDDSDVPYAPEAPNMDMPVIGSDVVDLDVDELTDISDNLVDIQGAIDANSRTARSWRRLERQAADYPAPPKTKQQLLREALIRKRPYLGFKPLP